MRLLLLPGLDGTGDLFAPFTDAVASAPGLGLQATVLRYPTQQVMDYAALTDLARAALPTDEPFVLLGESFSGPIAIRLASEAPPGLRGLVLCCSFVRNPRRALAPLAPLTRWLPLARMPRPLMDWALLGRLATPALSAALGRAVTAVDPAVLRARLQAVIDIDATSTWRRVKVPSLYLRGLHDRLVPASVAKALAHQLPHTQRADIDAPHALLQTAPEAAAQAVARFVAGLGHMGEIRHAAAEPGGMRPLTSQPASRSR